jgi:predicted peptidase
MQFKRFARSTVFLVALTLTQGLTAQGQTAAVGGGGAQQPQPGTQQPQAFEKQVVHTLTLKYLLYLPKEYGKEADKKWPVMVFLHGSGERGSDLEKVKAHGPPKLIAAGKEFPFLVVSPQAPLNGKGWDVETLNGMLDEVMQKYSVDASRVYLTGLSMGGGGTWTWATSNPERFAAIAPICGFGSPLSTRRLKNVPAWVFHGEKDPTVPVNESHIMVDAMKAAGGDVKLTLYPEAGHDSWTETYNNPELYIWFLSHTRSAPTEPKK